MIGKHSEMPPGADPIRGWRELPNGRGWLRLVPSRTLADAIADFNARSEELCIEACATISWFEMVGGW